MHFFIIFFSFSTCEVFCTIFFQDIHSCWFIEPMTIFNKRNFCLYHKQYNTLRSEYAWKLRSRSEGRDAPHLKLGRNDIKVQLDLTLESISGEPSRLPTRATSPEKLKSMIFFSFHFFRPITFFT